MTLKILLNFLNQTNRGKIMINPDFIYTNKKQLYMCKLKIDGKIIDKIETDDYEVWYDKITDKIYELNEFMKIEINIYIYNT